MTPRGFDLTLSRTAEGIALWVHVTPRGLGVRRDAVQLDPRSRGRRKRVRIAGDADALEQRLQALAQSGEGERGATRGRWPDRM